MRNNEYNYLCLIDRHFPSKIEDQTNGKPHQKDCLVCSKRKTFGQKTTTYKCKQCDLPLCVVPCFDLYHMYKDQNDTYYFNIITMSYLQT